MKSRIADKIQPITEPVRYCECGKPIYDGRRKVCAACKAAAIKTTKKRAKTINKYAAQEELMAEVTELEHAIQMQEWILQESKKRLAILKAIVFKYNV